MSLKSEWCQRQTASVNETEDIDKAFRIDLGRLTNSAAIRRLQGKTQVMSVGEHDFFRTRLTHSMEVANIGISISRRLEKTFKRYNKSALIEALPSDVLIQTICLAHDLGHPAFGHVGEKILNYHMRNAGGFEGNGQTLRLLGKLGEYYPDTGYNMTRRTLLGVIKYPVLFSDATEAIWRKGNDDSAVEEIKANYLLSHSDTPRNLNSWKPPKCLHDDEKALFDWILEPLCAADKNKFIQLNAKGKTIHKSFDCSIMELADDISYAFHDLEDVLAMNLVSRHQVIDEVGEHLKTLAINYKNESCSNYFSRLIESGSLRDLKRAISELINHIINYGVRYDFKPDFEEPLLSCKAKLLDEYQVIVDDFKAITFNHVIRTPKLQTLEYKGLQILDKLFLAIKDNKDDLLPADFIRDIKDGKVSLERAVCDYLACMTDREAGAMYERMFTPSSGSVFQPVQ